MASLEGLLARAKTLFADHIVGVHQDYGELTLDIKSDQIASVCQSLRDDEVLRFVQLIDLCGVDYSTYAEEAPPNMKASVPARFAVVYHLLSLDRNQRLRLRVYLSGEPPLVMSVVDIWASANWYEREAFDLFGIVFEGHPDLRRILTDYGFIGHPFRKDFPLIGHVEMRYDAEKGRVVYQPVSIEPRVLVPRTIREEGFGERDS